MDVINNPKRLKYKEALLEVPVPTTTTITQRAFDRPLTFLSLPREIRNAIYSFAWEDTKIRVNWNHMQVWCLYNGAYGRYTPECGIPLWLLTCKQILQEALEQFHLCAAVEISMKTNRRNAAPTSTLIKPEDANTLFINACDGGVVLGTDGNHSRKSGLIVHFHHRLIDVLYQILCELHSGMHRKWTILTFQWTYVAAYKNSDFSLNPLRGFSGLGFTKLHFITEYTLGAKLTFPSDVFWVGPFTSLAESLLPVGRAQRVCYDLEECCDLLSFEHSGPPS